LLDALNAGGGDFNALARHATAALLNAEVSGVYSDINYYIDEQDITDPALLTLLEQVDGIDGSDPDGFISTDEVIKAVQSAGTLGVELLKDAFDAMNNMQANLTLV